MNRITKEEWIERFKNVHGDKYDYSLVEYKNSKTKIKIICNKCGNIFEQLSQPHLRGQGCPFCKGTIKKTTEQFIKQAKSIHNNKYDYSLVDYKNNYTKVKIKCNRCQNVFEQTPTNHLKGKECPFCKSTKTTEQFIKDAVKVHGNKYDYSLVDYKKSKIKVKIKCNRCQNIFEQKPNSHLNGNGCPYCSGKNRNTASFIEQAKLIHGNKYDYSLVNYIGGKTKIKIICNKCGNIFEQTPSMHLQGDGCHFCKMPKGETKIKEILNKNNILFKEQKKYSDLKDINPLSYDFYLPIQNILIEYNGIQHYKIINHFGGYKIFLIQKHHDWLKRKYAKKNDIKLLTIPYWEFNNIDKILKENLSGY